MKPARPLDLAAIRARAAAPMHFDAISARSEIPWLRETVVALADDVERLRAATQWPPLAQQLDIRSPDAAFRSGRWYVGPRKG